MLRGVDYGDGFTWTYGPLGFLAFPIAVSGWTLVAAFAYVAATRIALAYLLVRGGGVVGVVLAFLALGLPVLPADNLVLIEVGLLVAALRDERWEGWFPYVGGAVAGLAALTKTNSGALAVGLVVVGAVALRGRALLAPGVAAAVFVAGWLATGSPLQEIPGWLRLSAGLVSGYSPAMQYEARGLGKEYVYAALAVLLLGAGVAAAARRLPRGRALALVVGVGGFAFAFFKEGFVRHDATHSVTFFAAAAVVCVLVDRTRLAAVLTIALAIYVVRDDDQLAYAPIASTRVALTQARDVASSQRRNDLVASSNEGLRRSYQFGPAILGALRGRTVQVLPFETAAIAAYDLRWRPLPVVQDYSAYTRSLDEANASFLASAAAPQRLLLESTTSNVNDRMRETEAPAEQRAMICNYRPVVTRGVWQVLARSGPRCGPPRVLSTVTVPSAVPAAVPDAGTRDLVVARIRLEDTFSNRLRGLLFKPREPEISLGGGPFTQLVAATAGDGVILHVPASAGLVGEPDWRTIAVATHVGGATIQFVAYRVRGDVPRSSAPLPPARLRARPFPARVEQGGGFVDAAYERRGVLVLRGWAGDAARGISAKTVLVYADGRIVWAGAPNRSRPDVARTLAKPGLARSGFELAIPEREVRSNRGRRSIRVVAVVGDRMLETTYLPSFGWR